MRLGSGRWARRRARGGPRGEAAAPRQRPCPALATRPGRVPTAHWSLAAPGRFGERRPSRPRAYRSRHHAEAVRATSASASRRLWKKTACAICPSGSSRCARSGRSGWIPSRPVILARDENSSLSSSGSTKSYGSETHSLHGSRVSSRPFRISWRPRNTPLCGARPREVVCGAREVAVHDFIDVATRHRVVEPPGHLRLLLERHGTEDSPSSPSIERGRKPAVMPLHDVVDERRVRRRRTPCARARCPSRTLEQPLAPAQDERGHDERELVDVPTRERLTDHIGSAHDVHVLIARRDPAPCSIAPSRLPTNANASPAGCSLVRWVTMKKAVRGSPGRPVVRRLVRPAPRDDRPETAHRLVHPSLVLARHPPRRLGVIAPGTAEHPVVQALPALAETAARPIVRARDVPRRPMS